MTINPIKIIHIFIWKLYFYLYNHFKNKYTEIYVNQRIKEHIIYRKILFKYYLGFLIFNYWFFSIVDLFYDNNYSSIITWPYFLFAVIVFHVTFLLSLISKTWGLIWFDYYIVYFGIFLSFFCDDPRLMLFLVHTSIHNIVMIQYLVYIWTMVVLGWAEDENSRGLDEMPFWVNTYKEIHHRFISRLEVYTALDMLYHIKYDAYGKDDLDIYYSVYGKQENILEKKKQREKELLPLSEKWFPGIYMMEKIFTDRFEWGTMTIDEWRKHRKDYFDELFGTNRNIKN